MIKKIAIIQTSLVSHKYLNEQLKIKAPLVKVINIIDDSLLSEVSSNGGITSGIINRMCKYFDSATSLGVDLIVNQCSSVGEAAEIASKTVNVPVLRIDEPMAQAAVRLGRTIGVVATVSSTIEPSCNLIKRESERANKVVEIIPYLVDGALDVLFKDGQEKHNELVVKTIRKCENECDVIVLAQGSMIIVLPDIHGIKKPVLTSPDLCIQRIVEILGVDS